MRIPEQKERRSLVLSEQTFPIIGQITAGMPGGFFIYYADGDEGLIYALYYTVHPIPNDFPYLPPQSAGLLSVPA